MIVSWFSAGVSSAVATKLEISRIDEILFTHIDDHHSDTDRFLLDCEKWFGKKIGILRSRFSSVDAAIRAASYVNGVRGAPCTRLLKRDVRKHFESDKTNLTYVWGLDCSEVDRANRIRESMPEQEHIFPLIDRGIDKEEAHRILMASKIKRPAMYDLGYSNNNCIGCVKGGMGYWNRIRIDFPDVFRLRAETERLVGGTAIKGIYLDELDPCAGRHSPPIVGDCGIFCEIMGI